MEENRARKLLVNTGKKLLETGLVARTWGNISCRLDEENIAITPSGLDYKKTSEDDIVKLNIFTGDWQGRRKPSGEKKIHIAVYKAFPDVNFVIHTHQTYASAIGLVGIENLDITEDEREKLGGITRANYGLPGTKMLSNAVSEGLKMGAKVILMEKHGALVCGSSQEETIEKAMLLEEICKRNIKFSFEEKREKDITKTDELLKTVRDKFKYIDLVQTAAVLECASKGLPIYAQLDDMAQMIGRKIPVIVNDINHVVKALERKNAVLVSSVGALVRAETEDDMIALRLLVDKAAVSNLHTAASNVKTRIGIVDASLMKLVYKMKYSKQKDR